MHRSPPRSPADIGMPISMAQESLQKLRIHRNEQPTLSTPPRRSRRHAIVALVMLLVIAAIGYLGYAGWLTPGVQVEVGVVTLAYPSQAFTLLNGTGYVVAQRRADVASKATGRLEWLGVEEGSRVQKGQVIARLESQDVTATMEQAAANVGVAKANVEQAQAEQGCESVPGARTRSHQEAQHLTGGVRCCGRAQRQGACRADQRQGRRGRR